MTLKYLTLTHNTFLCPVRLGARLAHGARVGRSLIYCRGTEGECDRLTVPTGINDTETLGSTAVKIKVVPVHAMKAYRGSRCVAPLILNLGAGFYTTVLDDIDQWFPNFFGPPPPWFHIHTHSAPLPF
jgi:hypothetical protein